MRSRWQRGAKSRGLDPSILIFYLKGNMFLISNLKMSSANTEQQLSLIIKKTEFEVSQRCFCSAE